MVYLDMNSVLCTSINQSITESSRLDGDPWPCFGSVSTKRGLPARRHPSARQYEPYQCEVAAVIGMEGAFAKGIFSEVERMERVTVFQWPAYHNLVTIDIAALLWRHYPTSAKPHEGLKFSLAWPSWIAAAVLPRYEKRSCLRRLTSIRRMGKTRPKNKKQPLHATWMN